jgi:hypothetical protein
MVSIWLLREAQSRRAVRQPHGVGLSFVADGIHLMSLAIYSWNRLSLSCRNSVNFAFQNVIVSFYLVCFFNSNNSKK